MLTKIHLEKDIKLILLIALIMISSIESAYSLACGDWICSDNIERDCGSGVLGCYTDGMIYVPNTNVLCKSNGCKSCSKLTCDWVKTAKEAEDCCTMIHECTHKRDYGDVPDINARCHDTECHAPINDLACFQNIYNKKCPSGKIPSPKICWELKDSMELDRTQRDMNCCLAHAGIDSYQECLIKCRSKHDPLECVRTGDHYKKLCDGTGDENGWGNPMTTSQRNNTGGGHKY